MKLVLECKTHWNLAYLMLSVALVYIDVFPHLKTHKPQYKYLPTKEDYKLT